MRTILRLVAKDLLRKRRSPVGLVVVLLFPVIFASLLGLAFGRNEGPPKIRLLVRNADDGVLSRALVSAFTSEQAAAFLEVRVVGAEGRAMVDRGEASALLVVPEGFTRRVLDGDPVALELVRNPAEGILPEIAEQLASILADVLDGASRALREPLDRIRAHASDGKLTISDEDVAEISVDVKNVFEESDALLFPPVITLEDAFGRKADEGDPDRGSGAVFLAVLPGVAVYALFLIGDLGMRDVLTESFAGTLKRQLAGPVSPRTVVVAKAVYSALLCAIGAGVLTLVGAVVLRRGVDPAGFLLASAATILAVTGTASVVYGLARTERQGATTSSAVYLALAFLGGSFFPVSNLPAALRELAPFSPFYWGTAAFRTLLQPGGTLAAVWPHVLGLAALGAAALAFGAYALGRTVRRGGAS